MTKNSITIFNTFKTDQGRLTGEARRQREIISMLAYSNNPPDKTRTAIAKSIAEKTRIPWKNMYSGIFRDLDDNLIPLGLVYEEGRLPMKRGPRALQEAGVPYYGLTQRGMIVALSFDSGDRGELLHRGELDVLGLEPLRSAFKIAPSLVWTILEDYVRMYAAGQIDEIVPFQAGWIGDVRGGAISAYREMLATLAGTSKQNRDVLVGLLDGAARGRG